MSTAGRGFRRGLTVSSRPKKSRPNYADASGGLTRGTGGRSRLPRPPIPPYVTVRGIGCAEARRLGEAGTAAQRKTGFACVKKGEGSGYTAWKCTSTSAAFTFRYHADG